MTDVAAQGAAFRAWALADGNPQMTWVIERQEARAFIEQIEREDDSAWEDMRVYNIRLEERAKAAEGLQARLDRAVGALRTAQQLVQAKSTREVWIYLEGELLALAEIEESA